eukprot:337790_1
MSEQKQNWIQLNKTVPSPSSCPFKTKHLKNNIYAFSVASHDGIYGYNVDNNKWKKWQKYPETISSTMACVDDINKNIYVIDRTKKKLLIINYIKNSTHIVNDIMDPGRYAKLIYIYKLYLIGGDRNGKHLFYNKNKKKIEEIYEFEKYENGIDAFGLIE